MNLMMTMRDFETDLQLGEAGEDRFLNAMINLRDVISARRPSKAELKKFDLAITFHEGLGDIEILYEIKTDERAAETSNFAIERTFKNQASGLKATQADKFVLIDRDWAYVYATQKLRNLCNRLYQDGSYFRRMSGDYNAAELFLYPKDILKKYAEDEILI